MIRNIAIVSLSRGIIGESDVQFEVEIGLGRLKEYGLHVRFMPHKEETIQANIKFVKSCSKDSDIWTAVTIATQMLPIKATKYARMSTISWDIEG